MHVGRDFILPSRVLNEDDDFVTLEVAKHDGVTFTLQQDENLDTVGGDTFLTLMFVHFVDGKAVVWKPWEESAK